MSEDAYFLFALQTPLGRVPGFAPVAFASLEAAYCDVCAGIPDAAAVLLGEGVDPMACSYLICDQAGTVLMDVPFTEVARQGAGDRPPRSAMPIKAVSENVVRARRLQAAARTECERARRAISRARTLMSEADRLGARLESRAAKARDPRMLAGRRAPV